MALITTGERETSAAGSFTGRRRRTTRKSVKIVDAIAKYVICLGGIGVTLAFAGIIAFLMAVVIPLFSGAKIDLAVKTALKPDAREASSSTPQGPRLLAMGLDENLASIWILDSAARLTTSRVAGGEIVHQESLSTQPINAVCNNRGDVALGFSDGTARLGRIEPHFDYLEPSALAPGTPPLKTVGQSVVLDGTVANLTGSGQVRTVRIIADFSDPLRIGPGPASPIVAVDYLINEQLEALVAMRGDGRLFFDTITKTQNMMTGKVRRRAMDHELPVPPRYRGGQIAAVLMGQGGRIVYVVFKDGRLIRYNTDDPEKPVIAEEVSLLSHPGVTVSDVRMLLGNQTLIVADSAGGVSGWFAAPLETAQGEQSASDDASHLHMVKAHAFAPQAAAVVAIGASARDRQFVTADAAGNLFLRHMTSGTTQGQTQAREAAPVALVGLTPKNDAIAVVESTRQLTLFQLSNPHPDGSLRQLFARVWYEGYPKPQFVYQSSAASDDAEPKFSLVPLIFGTLKATLYAMLFAVPLSILAAIYSSEFMQPSVRNFVKPSIEMMASLPSVVLGFIAALVLAPWVEQSVLAVILMFLAIPAGAAAFGFIWQVIPMHIARLAPGWLRFGVMLLLVILSARACLAIAPAIEQALFGGDFKAWLDGRVGNASPGWIMLLTPLLWVAVIFVFNLWIRPRLPAIPKAGRLTLFVIGGGRNVVQFGLALGLAALLAMALNGLHLDLRGSLVGGYVQRNTLIVGIAVGFAIIPIVYTLSEDALASVPDSLRAAALGAGATPWQTTLRVILPVAASGIFSACMIGLGRAAGETMIVLMASGRVPIIDMNIFNGLSALSANIATELPEASVNSTHYRVLFVSALVLFILTFAVNTTAEMIRIRFRRRAYQL